MIRAACHRVVAERSVGPPPPTAGSKPSTDRGGESGAALIIALVVMITMGLIISAVVTYAGTSERSV
ncbi:MAG TPA: hypothetical protein VGM93_04155, partial [Acidimicrobiales bacterium]